MVDGDARTFPGSLCHRCVHHRLVRGGRSSFLLCREPSMPKYLPQPVRSCDRFAPGAPPDLDPA